MSDRPLSPADLPRQNVAQARHPELVNRDREMIPSVLLKAMAMLVATTLVLVSYAVLTDRPLVGVPPEAPELRSKYIVLDGETDGSVRVLSAEGAVLQDLGPDEGGFVSVVWRAMARDRMLHGVADTAPLKLVEYANGRLQILDEDTGWSVELSYFGEGNLAFFERIMDL